MAKLDKNTAEILKKYGQDPAKACWDLRGKWIVLHWACERMATEAGITFDPPVIIEADSANGVASMCVTGHMGDIKEWSIGECAPKNNKNAYPWSMAEKRGKDRVILKLLGLHGLAYSEEELDRDEDENKRENQPGHLPTMKSFRAEAAKDFPSQELSPIGEDGVEDWSGWDETIRQLIAQTPNKGALDMLYKDNSGSFSMYKEIEPESHDKLISQFAARKDSF